jgi:hypothetical protein
LEPQLQPLGQSPVRRELIVPDMRIVWGPPVTSVLTFPVIVVSV